MSKFQQFIENFKNKFQTSSIKIIEEVSINRQYIIVQNEFGLCKIRKQHLLNGVIPTIESAIDKNSYFINKVNKIHANKYDYSLVVYTTAHKKVKIVCKIHGEFEQEANAHLKGQGCPICGDLSASIIHSKHPTGWSKTNWKNTSKTSKKFDNFKVYIIKCWNDNESFYKIGRTFVSMKNRFPTIIEMPYSFEIIKIFVGEAEEIYDLENKLKEKNNMNKYLPKLIFNGSKECFKKISYENVI